MSGSKKRAAGGAYNRYAALLAALLTFLFAGSLFIGLAGAMGVRAAPPVTEAEPADASGEAFKDKENETADIMAAPSGEQNKAVKYYVLPLSDEMQDEVYLLCDKYDVPPELVFGIISAEAMTALPYSADGGNKAMGLPADSTEWCAEQLGIVGEPTFDQNLECGVLLLSEYCHKYYEPGEIAMCYELGEKTALERISQGETSTPYSRLVVREMTTLTERSPKTAGR